MQPQPATVSSPPADYQVLLHAISSCAAPVVQQLIQQDPKLVHIKGWNGHTPLHKAVLTGDWAVTSLIVQAGADPNVRNDFEETPVHYACKRGIPSLLHILVQNGGDLTLVDKKNRGPVHHAAQTGSVYMLHYLACQGLKLDEVDEYLQNPLHICCSFGHLDAFLYLMRKGRCDPTKVDYEGNAPLHICAREGYGYGSWVLLNRLGIGALHVKNKAGDTPVDLVRQHKKAGTEEIKPVLENLYKEPDRNKKIPVPWKPWYWMLLMPFIIYGMAIVMSKLILTEHQGIWFTVALLILINNARTVTHRMSHVCRWPNPFYAGMFGAGVFHTMLLYYCHLMSYVQDYQYLIALVLVLNVYHMYLYWKVLTADPGVVKQTAVFNKQTKQPMQLTDLCGKDDRIDLFCTQCEFVKTIDTKHCRLCEQCFYRMDHHCLFLLKCIANKNHLRFVWFIIYTLMCMILFLVQVGLYCNIVYSSRTGIFSMLVSMFWTDAWVLSLVLLNIASIVWGVNLVRYQLNLVSMGQTYYFCKVETTLTADERWMNVVYFLLGKEPFAREIVQFDV